MRHLSHGRDGKRDGGANAAYCQSVRCNIYGRVYAWLRHAGGDFTSPAAEGPAAGAHVP